MGKTKQAKEPAKKFDRNVEISAPILDPEIIKAIHTPPKGQKLDIRHGGFKALLSDLNSQDSMDDPTPINDNHVPSYIGISCAVSGYSNYSSYTRANRQNENHLTTAAAKSTRLSPANRSETSSPNSLARDLHPVKHITIDKSNLKSPDEERIKLTEELTASATERRLSPSPLPPIEDERHHGAYVGARYCPMPAPSKLVHKHIPLLGIDDDQDPDLHVDDEGVNKVEKKIASLYGDEFVEDWRESMSHKAKKELPEQRDEQNHSTGGLLSKDLVTLKPVVATKSPEAEPVVDLPTPNVKVLAGVEKQFLNKLLTDENPPRPKSPSPISSPTSPKLSFEAMSASVGIASSSLAQITTTTTTTTSTLAPTASSVGLSSSSPVQVSSPATSPEPAQTQSDEGTTQPSVPHDSPVDLGATTNIYSSDEVMSQSRAAGSGQSPQRQLLQEGPQSPVNDLDDDDDEYDDDHSQSQKNAHSPSPPPMSPDSGNNQSLSDEYQQQNLGSTETAAASVPGDGEEHIEYEIRAQSPLDNQSSPVRVLNIADTLAFKPLDAIETISPTETANLVSFSPEPQAEERQQLQQLDGAELIAQQPQSLLDTGVDLMSEAESYALSEQQQNLSQIPEETVEELADKMSDSILHDDIKAKAVDEPQAGQGIGTEQMERKLDETGDDLPPTETSDTNNKGLYYLNLLEQEKSFILEQVERAESMLHERESVLDEDAIGLIRSAIGKANLLVNKRCNQFKELCERSINRGANEQYAVLNDDLAGFWDMLSIQFCNVRKSFESIQ